MQNLYVRVAGGGPPLVILHGLFGSGQNWASLARRFEAHFTVMRVDLPGHGQSPHSAPYTLPAMAALVRETVKSLLPTPVAVMAHSLGGRVAMHWAMEWPGELRHLVVVDVAHRPYDMVSRFAHVFRGMAAVTATACPDLATAEGRMVPHIADGGLRKFLLTNLVSQKSGGVGWRVDLEGLKASLPALGEAAPGPPAESLPTCLLVGGKSDYVTEADLGPFTRVFPKTQIKVFPEAGHWIHADDPEGVFETVSRFLAGR